MTKRRLPIKLRRTNALHVTRVIVGDEKCVYVILADKKLRYPRGRSRIAYIGTTRKGAARIAASAAVRSDEVLSLRGVKSMEVRVVSCRPRQRVKTWEKLEAALALAHREVFGAVPKCNKTFHRKQWGDLLDYFAKARLKTILEDLA